MKDLVGLIDFDMPNRIKNHTTELLGFTTSALGVITANQEQVEWWLRCVASVIAILAGGASLYSFIKNQRKNAKAIEALTAMVNDPTIPDDERASAVATLEKVLKNQTINPE